MFLASVLLLISNIVHATALHHEFELYDEHNPGLILAVRDDVLFFIYERDSRIQKEITVFNVANEVLKQGNKNVCSDGVSGRDLRLCKYADIFSEWRLRPVPGKYKIFELRNWNDQRCAVYGAFVRNERNIEIGPCFGNVIRFRAVNMDEYINGMYQNAMAKSTGTLNRFYDMFIPKIPTLAF